MSRLIFGLVLLFLIAFAKGEEVEKFQTEEGYDVTFETHDEESQKDFDTVDVSTLGEGTVDGHAFKAEINQLMSIIVNSLYSNRDIFIRELISNAADALEKIRYVSLLEPEKTGPVPASSLDIKVKIDKEHNLIHIRDNGIGMTGDELVANLGSIAKSGTKEFLKKIEAGDSDLTQIGQFGVGFYSSFLVADKVTVISKHHDDVQHIWESTMDESSAYKVAKDPRGDTLGRGTLITLHIKADAKEYLDTAKLTELIQHYNEFLTFPVYMWESKEVEVIKQEIEIEVDENEGDENEGEDKLDAPFDIEVKEDSDDENEEEQEELEPEYKTVWDWNLINSAQPLWTRSPSDLTDEDYTNFYTTTINRGAQPLQWSHFKAEGDVEFSALLYIPEHAPVVENASRKGVKLYVKKVFITENFDNFLPDYLAFMAGIVDSDDLPLNVSREMLQENKILKAIKKKLVRKIIALFQTILNDEKKWEDFYSEFHQYLKMGVMKDIVNRDRLSKLLRYDSAQNPIHKIGFSDYVEAMKEGQEDIFYIGGESLTACKNSPHIERLVAKGYDVLFMVDPIDEYMLATLTKFEGKYKFTDVSKTGISLDQSDQDLKNQLSATFKPLTTFLRHQLRDKIRSVDVSVRLSKSPAALVSSAYGYSANVERIIKAQALGGQNQAEPLSQKKILEINPRHPIIKHLLSLVENAEDEEELKKDAQINDIVELMYSTASLTSGAPLDDPAELASRLNTLISNSLGLDPELKADEEVDEVAKEDGEEDGEEDVEEDVEASDDASDEEAENNEDIVKTEEATQDPKEDL